MPKAPNKAAAQRRIFVSYAHADIAKVRELLKWLRPMCSRLPGVSEAWVDYEQLKGGDEWNAKILEGIEGANVFVVVMSIDYVDSSFCIPQELKRIMAKRAADPNGIKVIGLALREVPLANITVELDGGQVASLEAVQCLPQSDIASDGTRRLGLRAISSWPSERQDEAWNLLATQLEAALQVVLLGPSGDVAGGSPSAAGSTSNTLLTPASASSKLSALWLPYLANRDDQCLALSASLMGWRHTGFRRPLVALAEGRSEDCLPKWVDRLQQHELVACLGLDRQGASFGHYKAIAWPSAAGQQATDAGAAELFQRAFAYSLGPLSTSSRDEVLASYWLRQRPTLLWMALPDRAHRAQAQRALAGLLLLLRQWPDMTAANMLVLAINLERLPRAPAAERASLADLFESALKEAEADGAIHAALLGSLPELDETAITAWAQDRAAASLRDDITSLCTELPVTDNATWPMRTFAESARRWLTVR